MRGEERNKERNWDGDSRRERGRARKGENVGSERRRRIVGSSRVTSGRAIAVPGSCGVCRTGVVVAHPCAPFCVSIHPPSKLPLPPPSPIPSPRFHPSSSAPLSPSFIVPYRHIDSFSNSISLNGIKTILLPVRGNATRRGELRERANANTALHAAVRFSHRQPRRDSGFHGFLLWFKGAFGMGRCWLEGRAIFGWDRVEMFVSVLKIYSCLLINWLLVYVVLRKILFH